MTNELVEQLLINNGVLKNQVSDMRSKFDYSFSAKELSNLVTLVCDKYHQTKCAESEPVAKIVKNKGGQITIQKPDSSYFDISKHIGDTLYTAPQPSDAEAKLKAGLPPKDGKTYLGYFPSREGYFAIQCFIPIFWSNWGNGTWDNATSGHHISENPTHWVKLPLTPKQALEKIGV